MMKAVLILQLMFFFFLGTQIIQNEKECARVRAVADILISMPISSLVNIKI